MPVLECRYFTGYKPCGKNENCEETCPSKDNVQSRILIVHLEAIGAVLRATSILPALKRKFPFSHVTWVTKAPSDQLLQYNRMVDRVLTTSTDDLLKLKALEFDFAFVVDKSLTAMGVMAQTRAEFVYGFRSEGRTGAILPATSAAHELWEIGLSDQKKFFENRKAETQLIAESLELVWKRDPYQLSLTAQEIKEASERRNLWMGSKSAIIGVNTGCSTVIPYKRLTVEYHRKLIQMIQKRFHASVVLLGGREDTERNRAIAQDLPAVIVSPTEGGLRDGAISVAACDLILTGDSLGMHMGIALEKWVVAWFGPTCAHEIDLYDRGVAILSQAPCSPCWKRSCHKSTMCYDLVNAEEFMAGIEKGLVWLKNTSSFKQPSLETISLPSL